MVEGSADCAEDGGTVGGRENREGDTDTAVSEVIIDNDAGDLSTDEEVGFVESESDGGVWKERSMVGACVCAVTGKDESTISELIEDTVTEAGIDGETVTEGTGC